VLETWWAETDIAAARLLRRGLDFRGLADLDYATFSDVTRLAGEPSVSVTVESARVERRAVAVEPGTIREDVPCLVVRLNYDPSAGPFFVRLPGQDVGQEHRFYFEAGRYTGVFWTRGMKDVPDPRILHLISVAALKERALSKSLPLDRPDPARRRPGRP